MNEYPSVGDPQEFTQAEKAAFLGSAMCIATGTKNSATVTANIPFSDIRPTKLSDLTDDITVDTYDRTSEAPISGKGVAAALENFGGFQVVTLTSGANPVPDVQNPSNKVIYLTANGGNEASNVYDEWIYSNSAWEKVGTTTVDLSQYYTKSDTDNAFVKQDSMGTAIEYNISAGGVSVCYDAGLTLIDGKLCVLCDNDTTFLAGPYVAVTNPVPPPGTNEHRGEVLTVNNSDEIVWAAPASGVPDPTGITNGYVLTVNNGAAEWAPAGGGGSDLPEHTNADVGKVLGVLTGNTLNWVPGLPTEIDDQGSGASYYGGTRGIKALYDGNTSSPTFELGNGVLNYDYKTYPTGRDNNYWDTNNDIWSTTISNHEYKHMSPIEAESEDVPSRINLIISRQQLEPPHVLVEFANATGNAIPLYVGHQVSSTAEWYDGEISMPLKQIGQTYTDEHNIPAHSFVSIHVLGHGYFIYYRPLTEDEIVDTKLVNSGDTARYPNVPTEFY